MQSWSFGGDRWVVMIIVILIRLMFQVDLLFKLNNKMRFGCLVYAASFLAMMKHYINKNNNNKNNKI